MNAHVLRPWGPTTILQRVVRPLGLLGVVGITNNFNKEPQSSRGNSEGPYITTLRARLPLLCPWGSGFGSGVFGITVDGQNPALP